MSMVNSGLPGSEWEQLVAELESQRATLARLEAQIAQLEGRRIELEMNLSPLETTLPRGQASGGWPRVKMSFAEVLDLVVAVLFVWDVLYPLYPRRKPVTPPPPVPPPPPPLVRGTASPGGARPGPGAYNDGAGKYTISEADRHGQG